MNEGTRESAAPEDDPLIGRTIAGKFLIEQLVGAGSMGAVYRGQQIALERTIAIKVMRGAMANDETYAARFHLEAKAASRLDHPNVIRVFDYGREPDGLLYIAMEFLDCRDLLAVLSEERPLGHERLVDILSQTLSALAAAHDAGILHRDLKPENIMLLRRRAEDGSPLELVKVCDFGIAKLMKGPSAPPAELDSRGRPLTTGGLIIGTPEYMAPEQARGLASDARSDLYSVGVILYELLTGRVPFQARTPIEVLFKVLHEEAPAPGAAGPTSAPGLDVICIKAMSRSPEDRFQSAREMRAALRAAMPVPMDPVPDDGASAPDGARRTPETTIGAPPPRASRRSRWAGLAALFVAAAAALVFARRPPAPLPVSRSPPPLYSASATPEEPPHATALPPNDTAPLPSAPPTADARVRREPRRVAVTPSRLEDASVAIAPAPSALASSTSPVATVNASVPSPAAAPAPLARAALEPLSPPATAAPFDPATARVGLGPVKSNSAAATSGTVGRALHPLIARFTACYRDALARERAAGGTAVGTLHLETDDAGYINVARMTGDIPVAAASCIETVSRSARIQVDTGTANADVTLNFTPW